MVYPFRSKGERRSFSFNVYGKPKEEEPKPKPMIITYLAKGLDVDTFISSICTLSNSISLALTKDLVLF